ncbi:DNA alkylation repair protein [Streptomyces rameus]|uniref:DNA alkylation repair protein n=1 Tax=Streptomyces rameus TaxID=68261 RepID=UPI003CD0783B
MHDRHRCGPAAGAARCPRRHHAGTAALRCWELREYAKTDAGAVRAFVARERGRFAAPGVREALRNAGA